MSIFFEEKQRFTQWWLWLVMSPIIAAVSGLFIYGIVQQIIFGTPWGDKPMSDEGLIVFGIFTVTLCVGLALLFFNALLEIRVDKRAIEYRYSPIIRNWKRIERESIAEFRIKKYFTGHGIGREFNGTRKLTVKGNKAIEFKLSNGVRIMIGTQQPDEFAAAVKRMMNPKLD